MMKESERGWRERERDGGERKINKKPNQIVQLREKKCMCVRKCAYKQIVCVCVYAHKHNV